MATQSGVYLGFIQQAMAESWTTGSHVWGTSTYRGAVISSVTPPTIDDSTTAGNFGDSTPVYADLSAEVHAAHGTYDPATSSVDLAGEGHGVGDRAVGVLDWDATIPAWTSATITGIGLLVHCTTITSPVDPLLCFVDFAGTVASTVGTYTITLDANGFIQMDLVP